MPVTAPSNSFAPFIRKIGYSVGLESLLDRLRDFASEYGSKEVFSYSDVLRLVHSKWRLKNTHVLDVLKSLDVVLIKNGEVGVLEVGEALGILWLERHTVDFESALRFVLTHSVIAADGDIFLNALAANFEPEEFQARVVRMIEHKWSVLEDLFHTAQNRALIYRHVNIEVQPTNKGSRGRSFSTTGPLGHLQTPLPREGPLGGIVERPPVALSADYLRKTLPKRRAWAESLGLAQRDGAVTALGERLLKVVTNAGLGGPGCYAVWPMRHELLSPMFIGLEVPCSMASWDFMVMIAQGLDLVDTPRSWSRSSHEQGIKHLRHVFDLYWKLNQSKRMVRNQLLARVAYRIEIVRSFTSRQPFPMPEMIKQEQDRSAPRILARASREAELTLSLR